MLQIRPEQMINRCIVIVKVKEPFLQWLANLPDPTHSTAERVNRDNTAYLLPDYDNDAGEGKVLKQYYDIIFEEQLSGWWLDEKDWPKDRTFKMFKEWFDVEFHSVVEDLVDELLVEEDP